MKRFIEIEHFPEYRGTTFLIGPYRIGIALGRYNNRLYELWSAPLDFKKTISTRHFWLCVMKR